GRLWPRRDHDLDAQERARQGYGNRDRAFPAGLWRRQADPAAGRELRQQRWLVVRRPLVLRAAVRRPANTTCIGRPASAAGDPLTGGNAIPREKSKTSPSGKVFFR